MRSGRKATALPEPRSCEHCSAEFRPLRPAGAFCSARCRKQAWKDRATEGRVASVKRLKNGRMSVIVHMEQDVGLSPGQAVRLGEGPEQHRLIPERLQRAAEIVP